MNEPKEKKGPLAVIVAVLALVGLGLKSGCAKLIALGGDDAARAVGAGASHLEDSGVLKSVGKEAIKEVAPDAAEAAHDAYQDRKQK